MKPSKNHSNRRFHNWLIYDIHDKNLKKFSNHIKGKLVDLGCGEAPYKEFFLQFADEYIGVDWTKTLHNSKADIVSNLNEKIELPDNYADTLTSLSVMEHLCEPQVFLNEAYRILKKDSVFIIEVPWQWWIHEAPHDYFRYTPYGLKYLLEKAGFKDIQISSHGGYFTTAILKFNYFTARFVRGNAVTRRIKRALLLPLWYVGQKLAPLLDKLDKDWKLEGSGYYVVAKK